MFLPMASAYVLSCTLFTRPRREVWWWGRPGMSATSMSMVAAGMVTLYVAVPLLPLVLLGIAGASDCSVPCCCVAADALGIKHLGLIRGSRALTPAWRCSCRHVGVGLVLKSSMSRAVSQRAKIRREPKELSSTSTSI